MRKVYAVGIPLLVAVSLSAQPPSGGQAEERERKLVDKFDHDKDGVLNKLERMDARDFVKNNPRRSGGGPGRGRGPGDPGGRGPGGRGPGAGGPGGPFGGGNAQPNEPGPQVSQDEVASYDTGLYDEKVLRTFFLQFDDDNWEDELADFYHTDVMVPARLTVDGKTYAPVGVGFRGNSSFFTVSKGQKRSFNITMDYGGKKQDLYGYRTLNLLNSHSDPSFLREVVYNHIARQYTAAPLANFVKLVINGESWGVFGNAQQANKDFTDQWFGSRGGARWKISPGPGSDGTSLTYNGPEEAAYAGYQLKSKQTPKTLTDLIELCKVLNETPTDRLLEELEAVMCIDSALWFLALDNVLLDTDGYYSRGSDFMLYQHPRDGRFHVLTYDSNETFGMPGHGGPPGGGRGGPGGGLRGRFAGGPPPEGRRGPGGGLPPDGDGPRPGGRPPGGGNNEQDLKLSPFEGEENQRLAMLHRLLANPIIRSRYVAHVRTITEQWLDWKKVGPLIEEYHNLISDEVKADTRKLYSFEDFVKNLTDDIPGRRTTPGLRRFVDERGDYLRNHPDLKKPHPIISTVSHKATGHATFVSAVIKGNANPGAVFLYHSPARHARFQQEVMFDDGQHNDGAANDGVYAAKLPTSCRTYYYVEARAEGENPTTVFHPSNTERGSIEYAPELSVTRNSPVVINEVMASNTKTVKDPQGDFDDWVELHNRSDKPVDLSGKFLTDSKANPRKWAFPDGTVISANGYLIVWADNDKAKDGLHASFKLSKGGESIVLVDADGVAALDTLRFDALADDVAYGLSPDSGKSLELAPTPGRSNSAN